MRLGLVGAGWIARQHLEALDRIGRTELVGVVSRTREGAARVTGVWGGSPFDDLDRMLDTVGPNAVYVCVPPDRAVAIGERLVERGIPFLTEKPLAADDSAGPRRLADAIERAGLTVAVGYHLRGLDFMTELRDRLASRPPRMIVARWLDGTPSAEWWGIARRGGGQVIEQATHLYDLARLLLGEADVVGAVSNRDPTTSPLGIDVADATTAVLRFSSGAIGSFSNTRRSASPAIEVEIVSDELLTTLTKRAERGQGDWHLAFDDGRQVIERHSVGDPYANQAGAFLDALEAADPARVLSSYGDALKTDRLTRAVVAATGVAG